jgi:hypothetical protein
MIIRFSVMTDQFPRRAIVVLRFVKEVHWAQLEQLVAGVAHVVDLLFEAAGGVAMPSCPLLLTTTETPHVTPTPEMPATKALAWLPWSPM